MNFRARIASRLLPFAVLLQFLLFSYFLLRTMIRQPFIDMLAWLVSYLYFKDHGGLGAYLWGFHNEHRLVWMRLLTIADVEWFHVSGFPFIVAGTASLMAAAAMAGTFIRRLSHSHAVWLAPMLILTSANAVDCSIPIDTVYPIAVFFLTASIVLFESETTWHRAAALPIAASAAFGNGAGLAIWPILVWVSWRQRTSRTWTMLVASCGVLFIGVYTHGSPSTTPLAAALGSDLFVPDNILKLANYALAFLGLPFSRAPALATAGRAIGLAFLAAGVFAFVRVTLIERANTKLNRFAVALILFTIGSAAMVAISRAHLDPDVRVPVRYAVMVAPLHVGLLGLVIQHIRYRTSIGIAGALLAMQIVIGMAAIRVSNEMRQAISAYYQGNRDPEVTRYVFTDPASAELLTSIIRDRGLLGTR